MRKSNNMNLCIVGEGAFGCKHIQALKNIREANIVSLVGGVEATTKSVAKKYGINRFSTDYGQELKRDDIDAVILATPTQMHAEQAIQALDAKKHVLVEIPMADNIIDAQRLVDTANASDKVAMVGHVRRFNPSHQWIKHKIRAGKLSIQHLVVETFFFRRTNINALGEPRSWTDHLLWHHACHTVDLFQYQTGEVVSQCYAVQGPIHPELGIALDMSIIMKVPSGAVCTLALSFNNDGPLGTNFRYVCDKGTYLARYDDLFDGQSNSIDLTDVDVSMNGIELIDREFINAISAGREPNSSVVACFSAMQTLERLAKCLDAK